MMALHNDYTRSLITSSRISSSLLPLYWIIELSTTSVTAHDRASPSLRHHTDGITMSVIVYINCVPCSSLLGNLIKFHTISTSSSPIYPKIPAVQFSTSAFSPTHTHMPLLSFFFRSVPSKTSRAYPVIGTNSCLETSYTTASLRAPSPFP